MANYQIQATIVATGKRYTSIRQIPTFVIPNCASNNDAASIGLAVIVSSGCEKVESISLTVMNDDGYIWVHNFDGSALAPMQKALRVA